MPLAQEKIRAESGLKHKVTAIGPVWFKTSGKIYLGYLVNISREGITFQTRDLPHTKGEIVLSFQLPPSNYVFNLKAVVVWVSGSEHNDMPRGLGVRFIALEAEDEKHIERYISRFQVPEYLLVKKLD